MSKENLLTPREVADRLGLALHTLAVWRTERRNLTFIKVGRLVRYPEPDVDRYVTARTYDVKQLDRVRA
jgi:excisionase family DNA binding protein